ncbi:GroES-like protein [Biscogniauxia marginata]|nr:GroES-like protein [Biscogniauxia marginata]
MATGTPATTKAIVYVEKGKAEIQEVSVPKVRDDYILVKVKAVGLNPADWKIIHGDWADAGTRSGCDFAGEVVGIGPNVTKDIKKGDRIAGFTHGGNRLNHDTGAFGGYALVKQHMQMKIPEHVSDEEAATLGVSVTTVGQGLYSALGLPLPNRPAKEPFPVLIYGGSTATGIYGIQYAKASGLTVIATASPRNSALLRSLGADAVLDYRSPACAADIRALAGGRLLRHAWDCTGDGAAICAAALSSSSGSGDDDDDDDDEKEGRGGGEGGGSGGAPKYATIAFVDGDVVRRINPAVEGPLFTLAYDAFGTDYANWNGLVTAKPEERDFAAAFWELSAELVGNGTVKLLRPTVNRGGPGLEGVLRGLDDLKNGKVSGTKLVYTL